ncbi:hypothetical protein MCUN1_003359 [Malassezia cuniculi]|uniref:Mmc1 C-terminal domain-containing protein n=1 Tax=Malassezia cuniculi TaxID=948313 RepID=A0AAF0J7W3_9BASI|nr:hypothetical protein MCUN1_003359 [Malassezia cuniculi]
MLRFSVGAAVRVAARMPRGYPGVRFASAAATRSEKLESVLSEATAFFAPTEWRVRIEQAKSDLAGKGTRIGLVGLTSSRVPELARALLYEPLDKAAAAALDVHGAALSEQKGNIVRFRSGATSHNQDAAVYTFPSGWLSKADTELAVVLDPSADEAHLDLLYTCDALCFVTDMDTLTRSGQARANGLAQDATLSLLARMASKPNTALIVNIRQGEQASYGAVAEHARKALGDGVLSRLRGVGAAVGTPVGGPAPGIMVVSSSLASTAKAQLAAALDSEQPTESQWTNFTKLYNGSYVPVLEHALSTAASSATGSTRVMDVLRDAIGDAEAACRNEEELLRAVEGHAAVLQGSAETALATAAAEVLPEAVEEPADAVEVRRGNSPASIRASVADARRLVEQTFVDFPWWSLAWRIDSVRTALQHAVSRSFAAGLEVQLAYAAGVLRGTAEKQKAAATSALQDIAKREAAIVASSTFDTATLRNSLARFDDSQLKGILTPTSLIGPIVDRRNQLLSPRGPIDQLTAHAQAAVMRAQMIAGSSYIIAAAGLLRGDALVGALSMSPATAAGIALLGTALSAWSVQGAWARIKRRFWVEWDHVADATERDEKACVEAVLRDTVFGAPLYTASALRDAVLVRQGAQYAQAERLRALAKQVESVSAAAGAKPSPTQPAN